MEGVHTLTSFKRLSPDSSASGFSFSRLFQRTKSEPSADGRTSATAASSPLLNRHATPPRPPTTNTPQLSRARNAEPSSRAWSSPIQNRQASTSTVPHSQYENARHLPSGHRNLTAVLGRLSIVAHRKGQLPQAYKESDFKQYWMPDENCKECYECGEKFNTFRRRHHCRLCGQIFCYRCCYLEIPGQLMGYTGLLRVCTYCHKIVCTYTQSPDMIRNLEQLQMDVRAMTVDSDLSTSGNSSINVNLTKPYLFVSEDDDTLFDTVDSRKVSNGSSNSPYCYERLEQRNRSSPVMGQRVSTFPFDAFGVCAAEADILKQDSLRELWHQITSSRSGIELQSHRFRLKTYHNCLLASELVDWLLSHEKASTRNQAVAIGQALLDSGFLEPVPINSREVVLFRDEYALFQQGPVAPREVTSKRSSMAHNDLEDQSGSWSDDANVEDDDETLPQWFRQLSEYESSVELEASSSVSEDVPKSITAAKSNKYHVTKLLNLDLASGTATDEKNSELSLQVDLHHFGSPNRSEDSNGQNKVSKLPLITDVPPPPLEQYVYSEGYPRIPLRPGNKKAVSDTEAAISADEIFSGAVLARKIGVDRAISPEPSVLREDNGERMAVERLENARMIHLCGWLKQLLTDAGLSLEWTDVMLPLVTRISEMVIPNVHEGDDMDIRQYVKFKKIPGGSKGDCQLVSGVVFTKHVANKKMACLLHNPRVLVLSCAIDYQRNENRLACLDPLVLQEQKFLKIFVARVAALRPTVLLVEKTVSRLAQDMLLHHGITLALNVKHEVIQRVARCTRADVLRSMDKLSQPRLGSCESFRVHKFVLKNGDSKTLMYFDGCPPELGCTVTLRGGNSYILAKVKHIMQYMVYVAYSLRLETHFLMDEFAMPKDPKALSPGGEDAAECCKDETSVTEGDADEDETRTVDKTSSTQQTDEDSLVEAFQKALSNTYLSSSPYLRYPLPYLLTNEGRRSVVRFALPKCIYRSVRLDPNREACLLSEEELEGLDSMSRKERKLSKDVHVLPPHPFVLASLTLHCSTNTVQALLADFRAQGATVQLVRKGGVPGRSPCTWIEGLDQIQRKAEKGLVPGQNTNTSPLQQKDDSEEKKFVPAAPLHSNKQVDCMEPQFHQRIAVLFSSYSSESNNSPRPCISPWAVFMEFYGRNDITLGGFLERYCFRPSYICPSPNCDVPMVDHVRYFAHGEGSVYIHMKNLESPIPGFQHTILTWSWCKECKQVTPIVPLSPGAWALSFAKYLELRFYADGHTRRASVQPCGHSLHIHHYQYFAYANMVASFKYRPIKLFETAIPPSVIQVKEERRDASYWISDVCAMSTKGDTVFLSILERVEALKMDPPNTEREAKLSQFLTLLNEEQKRFQERVLAVEKKAASLQAPQNPLAVPDEEDSAPVLDTRERQALEYVTADSLNSLKKNLCEVVESWNNRLQEFMNTEKKKTNKGSLYRDGKPVAPTAVNMDSSAKDQGAVTDGIAFQASHYSSVNTTPFSSRTPSPYPVQTSTPDQSRSIADSTNGSCQNYDNLSSVVKDMDCDQSEPLSLDKSQGQAHTDSAGQAVDEVETRQLIDKVDRGQRIDVQDEGSATRRIDEVGEGQARNEDDEGSREVFTGQGNEEVCPEPEVDKLNKVQGSEEVCPGAEVNKLDKGQGTEEVCPGPEVDKLDKGQGTEEVCPGPEVDKLNKAQGSDEVCPGSEVDKPNKVQGSEEVCPGPEVDKLNKGQGNEEVCPGAEVDKLIKVQGTEEVCPGAEVDKLDKGQGNEEVCPGPEVDKLNKVQGSEEVCPGAEVDKLDKGQGTEEVCPGPEVDKLNKGQGSDEVCPGPEIDKPNKDQGVGKFDQRQSSGVPDREPVEINEGQGFVDADCGRGSGGDSVSKELTLDEHGSSNIKSLSQSLSPEQLHDDVFGSLKGFVVVGHHERNTPLVQVVPDQAPTADRLFVLGHRRVVSSPSMISSSVAASSVDDMDSNSRDAMHYKSRSWFDVSNSAFEQGVPSSQLRCSLQTREPGSTGASEAGNVDSTTVSNSSSPPFTRVRLQKTLSVPGLKTAPDKAFAFETSETEVGAGTGAEVSGAVKRRDKVKNMITSLLPGPNYQPVDSTFPCHEHHLLPPGEKVVVVVNEKEPTSIISYALSTKQYDEQLREIHQYLRDVVRGAAKENTQINRNESSKSANSSTKPRSPSDFQRPHHVLKIDDTGGHEDYVTVDLTEPQSDGDTCSLNSAHLEFMQRSCEIHTPEQKTCYSQVDSVRFSSQTVDEIGDETDWKMKEESPLQDDPSLAKFGFQRKDEKPAVEYHIKLPFSDNNTKFYCNVCFAEQFRNLRKRIFSESEERYIRSLQRCVVWRARGGKSGSTFSKSLDDRFVIKQMSRLELHSFIDFAPHYFQYINKALDEKRPTLLAKILGVYRIGFRNSQTNATMRQDVLVMENLFYDRKIDKIFDLKGSMRSRYVQSSGGENDVLLDENLLELIRECPIFIRAHSKTVFSRSIHNDTEFLSQQMVMDYSLLVGIDEAKSELVLGIIDFIRTFTWDKKLEMYVKSSGILGGQGKMPTVVSPELYRTRFTEAMHRYFLMVPDKWTGLGSDLG